ncbi:hypothetical protein OG883_43095 [Streptomyces sp. NBC_01142]|uniref:hypothetical protein n=1 Tax=Streptomyces sp. NBC_01142 TaxID=2975865 RepID=UPI002252A66D|nr:hypothetical protein [Streptomyces sp. NBC_01142]MCX4826429.1 hypothetical protein [Streptomyces sp. NBC_01142]
MARVVPTYRARYAHEAMRDLEKEVSTGKAVYEDPRQVTESVELLQKIAGHAGPVILQTATAYRSTSRHPNSDQNQAADKLLGEAAIIANQLTQKLNEVLQQARSIK